MSIIIKTLTRLIMTVIIASVDNPETDRHDRNDALRALRPWPPDACQSLCHGTADLFAFGRAFISNPDLVERLKTGAPLAQPDFATLYGGGAAGYTDYPPITA
jgi:hypothetical protein